MLRHARQDGVNKAEAAALFGLSRPTYYQAEAAFAREGLAGLLPRARGPKSAHKLTAEVMRLIEQHRRAGGSTAGALPGGAGAVDARHQRPPAQHRARDGA